MTTAYADFVAYARARGCALPEAELGAALERVRIPEARYAGEAGPQLEAPALAFEHHGHVAAEALPPRNPDVEGLPEAHRRSLAEGVAAHALATGQHRIDYQAQYGYGPDREYFYTFADPRGHVTAWRAHPDVPRDRIPTPGDVLNHVVPGAGRLFDSGRNGTYYDHAGYERAMLRMIEAHERAVGQGKVFATAQAHRDLPPFLHAMTQSPRDASPALIFADWLDERGHSALANRLRQYTYPPGPRNPEGQGRPPSSIELAEWMRQPHPYARGKPRRYRVDDTPGAGGRPPALRAPAMPHAESVREPLVKLHHPGEVFGGFAAGDHHRAAAEELARDALAAGRHRAHSVQGGMLVADPFGRVTMSKDMGLASNGKVGPGNFGWHLRGGHGVTEGEKHGAGLDPLAAEHWAALRALHHAALANGQIFHEHQVHPDIAPLYRGALRGDPASYQMLRDRAAAMNWPHADSLPDHGPNFVPKPFELTRLLSADPEGEPGRGPQFYPSPDEPDPADWWKGGGEPPTAYEAGTPARYASAADTRALARDLLADIGTDSDKWHRQLYYAALRKTGSIGEALDLLRLVVEGLPSGYLEAKRATRKAKGVPEARYAAEGGPLGYQHVGLTTGGRPTEDTEFIRSHRHTGAMLTATAIKHNAPWTTTGMAHWTADPQGHVTAKDLSARDVQPGHVPAVAAGHILGKFHIPEATRAHLRAIDAAHEEATQRWAEEQKMPEFRGRVKRVDQAPALQFSDYLEQHPAATDRHAAVAQKIRDRIANWKPVGGGPFPEDIANHIKANHTHDDMGARLMPAGEQNPGPNPDEWQGRPVPHYHVEYADHKGTPPTVADILHMIATEGEGPARHGKGIPEAREAGTDVPLPEAREAGENSGMSENIPEAKYAGESRMAGEGFGPRKPRPTARPPAAPPPAAPPAPAAPHIPQAPTHNLRPGQWIEDPGEPYYPHREPDLNEFLHNRFQHDYGTEDEMSHATGFLLSDGRPVKMGSGQRYEDHRAAIPNSDAMRRWGWPEEVVKEYEQGSRGVALGELLRRSGAARIHSGKGMLAVDARTPLTYRQKAALRDHIITHRPESVVLDFNRGNDPSPFGGTGAMELGPDDAVEHLS